MLEQLKRMEAAGQWMEIRQVDVSTLASLDGDQLARACLSLSKAHEVTAGSAAEYKQALAFARRAAEVAAPGGLMHTWALSYIAGQASDLGYFAEATTAAEQFMAALPHHPKAEAVAPWVFFHLGRVHYYRRRDFAGAARWFRRAQGAGSRAISERAALFLAWALAASGHVAEAAASLPDQVEYVSAGYLDAARATVCYASGDWHGAMRFAEASLREYDSGTWQVFDTVQAAEVYLILSKASQRLGQNLQADRWLAIAADTLSRWNAELMPCLVSTLRGKGGERSEEAVCSCGSAGHDRCGLRGVVG